MLLFVFIVCCCMCVVRLKLLQLLSFFQNSISELGTGAVIHNVINCYAYLESKMMLLALYYVSAIIVQPFVVCMSATISTTSSAVADYEFDQIISHQSVYEPYASGSSAENILPFSDTVSGALYDANGHCFVALTQDNIMWSSRRKKQSSFSASSYSSWGKVFDFSEYGHIQRFTKAPNSIVLATDSQLIEVVMDFTCSHLTSLDVQIDQGENSLGLSWGAVSSLISDDHNTLWMGTGSGLVRVDMFDQEYKSWQITMMDATIPVAATVVSLLWVDAWQVLFASTSEVLYELRYSIGSDKAVKRNNNNEGDGMFRVHKEWIQGNIDTTVISMTYDSVADCVWVVEQDAVHRKMADGSWWRSGYYQGAIANNITSISVEGGTSLGGYVWVGTSGHGLVRMQKAATDDNAFGDVFADPWLQWQLYNGRRYLPDSQVLMLVSCSSSSSGDGGDEDGDVHTTLVVTASGVVMLSTESWTLTRKGNAMQEFQYPRHDRNGIVAEVYLSVPGDVTTYSHNVEDSDSIWTGQYAVAAAMRTCITQDETDRKSAWRTFEALEMLGNVTGVAGLVARTMCSPSERKSATDGQAHPTNGCGTPGEGNWHESSSMPGWVWKGDTSSDTIDGHYFAYGIILDCVASTDEEKSRVVGAIDRLTSYIVDCDLYYIDISGEPTLWGRWNPTDLNDNPEFYSERGGNSLEILAFLALAYSVTEKEVYRTKFNELTTEFGYYENTLNQKIDNPFDDNHSDNELGFMAYHTLFYAHWRLKNKANFGSKNGTGNNTTDVADNLLNNLSEMIAPVIPSIRRWYSIVKNERSPLWVACVAGAAGVAISSADIDKAAWALRLYSIDMINWGVKNSNRWDCVAQPYGDRGDATASLMANIRPPMERILGHYNANPFKMDTSPGSESAYDAGGGSAEYSPAEWLLPYWMLRFYDLLQ